MTFDKSSTHRFGKDPEHTRRPQRTERGKIIFCKIIQNRCSIHFRSEKYRWGVSRDVTPFVALDLSGAPVPQLQIVFDGHKSHIEQFFETLNKAVGGYPEDRVRQLLHELGAKKTHQNDSIEEWWHLAERESELIAKRVAKK